MFPASRQMFHNLWKDNTKATQLYASPLQLLSALNGLRRGTIDIVPGPQCTGQKYLNFGTLLHLLLLRDSVGDHYSLKRSIVDARDGRARENTMGENGIDLYGTSRDQPDTTEYK